MIRRAISITILILAVGHSVFSQNRAEIEYEGGFTANIGTGSFAPYYISALSHGSISAANGLEINVAARRKLDHDKRFSWGAGAELAGGVFSGNEYLKYDVNGETFTHRVRPSSFLIRQLYAALKYRSLFIEAGMKNRGSALLDNEMTSGDLTHSGNASPIPQIRAGFLNFTDVPLTAGWLQVNGELAYGKFTDGAWLENFYSRGSSHINRGAMYVYRRLCFRIAPQKRLSATFGMQAAGEIGGTTRWYRKGELIKEQKESLGFKDVLKMTVPLGGRSSEAGEYYDGNNLGSWDILFRYVLPNCNHTVKVYLEKPWEKGAAIGWRNGFDGLWGLQFDFAAPAGFLRSVLFEYLSFMNQSGAVHFNPDDFPGTTITTNSVGGEQYYNNNIYNSYANYGMGLGTPFLPSPIYNLDGYPQYVDNRVKGFHIAAAGNPLENFDWKIAFSYRKGYGDGRQPRLTPVSGISWLAAFGYCFRRIPGLSIDCRIAMDRGDMPDNNFGILLGVKYSGKLITGKND